MIKTVPWKFTLYMVPFLPLLLLHMDFDPLNFSRYTVFASFSVK